MAVQLLNIPDLQVSFAIFNCLKRINTKTILSRRVILFITPDKTYILLMEINN